MDHSPLTLFYVSTYYLITFNTKKYKIWETSTLN